jgi:hypothetical protein
MKTDPDPYAPYMLTIWRHVGKILPSGAIKWSDDDHRVAYFELKTEAEIGPALKNLESGVSRVGGFSDIVISIEVVVQASGGNQLHDHHVCKKPNTLAELEKFEAA